jgi:hypothetical protein
MVSQPVISAPGKAFAWRQLGLGLFIVLPVEPTSHIAFPVKPMTAQNDAGRSLALGVPANDRGDSDIQIGGKGSPVVILLKNASLVAFFLARHRS